MDNTVVQTLSELAMNIPSNIASQMYDRIKGMIISGKLPSGFVFPCESDLCRQLNVGRTTLREAYKALEASGYITRTKRGTYVNDAEKIAASLPLSLALKDSDYDDLIEFRAIIESQISYLAAKRATAENIVNLHHYFDQMLKHKDNIQKLSYYDTKFHMELANASGNLLFQRIMLMSIDVFASGVYHAFLIDTTQNIKQALASHNTILAAVESHDCYGARDAMYEHLNIIRERSSSCS